jgi:Pyruvate/2-oxoacid:ferredoxin oxidoreductase gamma subunit
MMEKRRGADRTGIRALLGPPEKEEKVEKEEVEKPEVKEAEVREVDLIGKAVDEALRMPRVTIHSPITSAFVRYMKARDPGFDISRFLRDIVERGIMDRNPDIYRRVMEELRRRKVKEVEKKLGIQG